MKNKNKMIKKKISSLFNKKISQIKKKQKTKNISTTREG
jgi:hypothetical protein